MTNRNRKVPGGIDVDLGIKTVTGYKLFQVELTEEHTELALKLVDSKKSDGWIGALSKVRGQAWREIGPQGQAIWNEKARVQKLLGLPLDQRRKYVFCFNPSFQLLSMSFRLGGPKLERLCMRFSEKMWQECGAIVVPLWAIPPPTGITDVGMKDIIPQMLTLAQDDDKVSGKRFRDLFPDEFKSLMAVWGEYTAPYFGTHPNLYCSLQD